MENDTNDKETNLIVQACYIEQIIEEYKNNPFIEALPPIYSKFEVMDKLAVYPYINENEKNYDAHQRYHLIQRLFHYFQPMSIHLDLESIVSRILRQGYMRRNIMDNHYAESFNVVNQMIEKKELQFQMDSNSTSLGFSIIGASGMGKTTAINKVLSLMPQVIQHTGYKNKRINTTQVVYIKLNCPYDGSIRALCIEFFSEVDRLIGTNYFKKYATGKVSSNVMLPIMVQISQSINLGMLIIDEIQHLSLAKSGGGEKMLNFFVTLVNLINLPVIMIGTPKAMSLWSQFRQARRACGQGGIVFERMKKDVNWDLLVNGMFYYQWTKNETVLTSEINDVLYEESQGITDIAIKLYAMSQIKAISTGLEIISPDLIREVVKDNFQLIKPAMDALKSGKQSRISDFEDVAAINIEAFLTKEMNNIKYSEKLKEAQQKSITKVIENQNYVFEEATMKLVDLGIDPIVALQSVKKVEDSSDRNKTVSEIVKKAFLYSLEKTEIRVKKDKNEKEINQSNKQDLRTIRGEAKKDCKLTYSQLKDKGLIRL